MSYQSHRPTFVQLDAMARDFTEGLRRDFAEEIARDPRAFKKSVLRLVRRNLPPKRGRPNDPALRDAARMVE
jgi:hypothetical protein